MWPEIAKSRSRDARVAPQELRNAAPRGRLAQQRARDAVGRRLRQRRPRLGRRRECAPDVVERLQGTTNAHDLLLLDVPMGTHLMHCWAGLIVIAAAAFAKYQQVCRVGRCGRAPGVWRRRRGGGRG